MSNIVFASSAGGGTITSTGSPTIPTSSYAVNYNPNNYPTTANGSVNLPAGKYQVSLYSRFFGSAVIPLVLAVADVSNVGEIEVAVGNSANTQNTAVGFAVIDITGSSATVRPEFQLFTATGTSNNVALIRMTIEKLN